jgi:RNA polymerase sigma factor
LGNPSQKYSTGAAARSQNRPAAPALRRSPEPISIFRKRAWTGSRSARPPSWLDPEETVPRRADTTGKGLPARDKERLLHEYKPFILRTASVVLKRYVTDSDDAWSIALIAFSEALDQYDREKGNFEAYARLVIRRRLVDELRREKRFQPEIDVAPEAFSGGADPEEGMLTPVNRVVARRAFEAEDISLQEEIAEASRLLAAYGFSFWDLADCSPKAGKTRAACAAAVRFMLRSPGLIRKMRSTRHLPIYALATGSRVSLKALTRHRRYIIAVVEILTGDYPGLARYLQSVGRGEDE